MRWKIMHTLTTSKYGFRIRTRSGSVVDNLMIFGRDAPDAERKLRQIYLGCEILEARQLAADRSARTGPMSYEDVVDLISSSLSPSGSK